MLYMLGPVLLDIAPLNAVAITRDGEFPFAEHAVLGAAPLYENMGEGRRRIVLRGATFPHVSEFASGLAMLDVIEAARRVGQPVPLIRGDFAFLGYVLIERFRQDGESLDHDGVPKNLTFEVELCTCDAPAASSVFGLFSGRF